MIFLSLMGVTMNFEMSFSSEKFGTIFAERERERERE
jgi:hypothetical protein